MKELLDVVIDYIVIIKVYLVCPRQIYKSRLQIFSGFFYLWELWVSQVKISVGI